MYRKKNKEKCLLYQRKWQQQQIYKDYLLTWRKKNVKKIKQYAKEYRIKNKEKQKIWRYAFRNFRDNMINKIKKCQNCGISRNLELHHLAYDKNIDNIKLLCKSCHRLEHTK
jgi:hypothetical protein